MRKADLLEPAVQSTFQSVNKGGGSLAAQSRAASTETAVHSQLQLLYKGAIVFSEQLVSTSLSTS